MEALTAWDYLVIIVMLAISGLIGIIFAIRSVGRQQSSSNYFLGDRHMSVFPVAMSLTATYISAITYLGTPSEVYLHGPKYGLMAMTRIFVPFLIVYCFVPVFYNLDITTVYEYLGMRFNNTVRFLVVAMEFFAGFTYMGIVVYAPALALSTVTGLNLTFSILATGIICTFYTTIGGIKAVIWTDVFQAILMIVGTIMMIIAGTIQIGGPAEGWRRGAEGGRTQLIDFNIDPTVRLSFWSLCLGGSSYLVMIGATKQGYVQRYMSCASEREAQYATWLGILGTGVMQILAVTAGMTIFAYYCKCDPLTSGHINRPDQIVPYFIMDVFQSVPGMSGLVISGAFCASLSSMSSVLNAIASMTGQDIIKVIWPDISDVKYSVIIKIISALFGVLTIVLAFLASALGDILQTAVSLGGLTGGPVLGVFMLAFFVPRGNSKGATTGLIGGTLFGLYLYIGSQMYPPHVQRPPLTTEGCEVDLKNGTYTTLGDNLLTEMFTVSTDNSSLEESVVSNRLPGTAIFQISFLYHIVINSLISFIIGVAVSYLTSWKNPKLAKANLLAPIIARMYTKLENEKQVDRGCMNLEEHVPLQNV
ncbi:sodium-coupled monocarboxylate transporter 1-like [Apostichopus japonicus]|uniref:sodium-coupled monocarboxylate transporter 1-like n=1 Tax=Stichopus japonicus TaxID=307972 RepID=UPI003AB86F1D